MAYKSKWKEIAEYSADLANLTPLSQDEELDLFIKVRDECDMEARDKLIKSNLRLVVKIVRRHYSFLSHSIADLISYGNLGLIRAIETYSLEYETKFPTYASYWIKQSIYHNSTGDSLIRLPAYIRDLINYLKKNDLNINNIDEGKLTKNQIKYLKTALRIKVSSYMTDSNGILQNRVDFIHSHYHQNDRSEKIAELLKYVDELEPRLKLVIKKRFGINCERETLIKIASHLGITKERVRQLEGFGIIELQKAYAVDHEKLHGPPQAN